MKKEKTRVTSFRLSEQTIKDLRAFKRLIGCRTMNRAFEILLEHQWSKVEFVEPTAEDIDRIEKEYFGSEQNE